MSLVKKPTMTEKKKEASRRNGSHFQGAATAEGTQTIGGNQPRVEDYAEAQDLALRSFGEDPAGFEELLQGLTQEFGAVSVLQKRLVARLARVLWMVERADCSQEGWALRRAREADKGRENRMHAQMMRLKMTAETLRSLARSVSCWHYVTTREDLEVMKKLQQEGVAAEMGEIALGLFYQLQVPGTDEDGESEEEKARRVVNSVRSIFGIGRIQSDVGLLTPAGKLMVVRAEAPKAVDGPPDDEEGEASDKDDRYPTISEEDWFARERARKLLRNILRGQVEDCEAERTDLLKESLAVRSHYELAAVIAPPHAEALAIRRVQDANMRDVKRLTNLLLKLQKRDRKVRTLEATEQAPEACDVIEKTET